jgi:hypothetical protein
VVSQQQQQQSDSSPENQKAKRETEEALQRIISNAKKIEDKIKE